MKASIISKLAIIPMALLMGIGMIYSQTNENTQQPEKTIRIKMVKNINGVETVFDTTIVGGNWDDIHGQMSNIPEVEIIIDSLHENHKGGHPGVIVKTIDISHGTGLKDSNRVIMIQEGNDAEMEKILIEHGIDPGSDKVQKKIIIMNDEETAPDDSKGKSHKMEVRVIVKTCNIIELDKEDKKKLKSETKATFNDNLKIEQVDFYPNPNNGHFNLSFNLPNKGDTEISIFSMEGKNVYQESLPGFTGDYRKEIDISKNASGIYYIRVTQGKDSWFRKMILE